MNESYSQKIYEDVYRVKIPDNIALKIVKGLDHFQSIKEIAKSCNTTVQTVYNRIKEMGPIISMRNEIYKETIRQMKKDGYTDDEIAEELGIPKRLMKTENNDYVDEEIKLLLEAGNTQSETVSYRIKKKGERLTISKKQRDDAIIQGLIEGKKISQIASEQGISIPTVYYRINKMKKREKEIPKRKKKQENDKIDNAIIQGLREGKTQRQIASEMKIDPAVVSRRIKEMKERGEEIPKRKKKQENDEIDDAIIQGLREGKPKSQIARELKIAVTTVYKRINKMTKRGGEIPTISMKQSDDETIQRPEEKKSSQDQKKIDLNIIQKYEENILYLIQLKKPTQDQIKKLAEYYGIDADAFFEKYRNKINFFLDRGGYR